MNYELTNKNTLKIAKKYANDSNEELKFVCNLKQLNATNKHVFIINKCTYKIAIFGNEMRLIILPEDKNIGFSSECYKLKKVYNNKEKACNFLIVISLITFTLSLIFMLFYHNPNIIIFVLISILFLLSFMISIVCSMSISSRKTYIKY